MEYSIPMPQDKSREELLKILLDEEYGHLPPVPIAVQVEETEHDRRFCAGKAVFHQLRLTAQTSAGEFSFPVRYTERRADTPSPLIVHINFRNAVPDKYEPTEELVDRGYSVMSFCYTDVTSDDGDFTTGLAGMVYPDGTRALHDCGKIGLWAWAAMRVIDYAVTRPEIDQNRIIVAGHSRLGKTALLVGALDPRVYCAHSNDSGCGGASIARGNRGETVAKICHRFPYWFCEHYASYADREDTMPFDQHWLLCANAPHRVYVASAAEDAWADPQNEYLSCRLAADYFTAQGAPAAIPEAFPAVGAPVHGGQIGYHIRAGMHYFSREDWRYLLDYLEQA